MFLFISIALVILFVVLAIIGGTSSQSKNKRLAQQNDLADIAPSTSDKTSNRAIDIEAKPTEEEAKPVPDSYAELLKQGRDIEDLSNDEYDQLVMSYGRRHTDDEPRVEIATPTFDPKNFTALSFKRLTTLSAHAFQIGLVKVEDGRVTDSFFSYLNPMRPISQNLRNSLPDHLLADIDQAPKLEEIWDKVAPYLTSGSILTPSSYPDFSILGYYLAKFDAFPCDMVQAYCDTLSSYPVKQLLSQGKQLEQFTALDAAQEAANALLSGAKYTSDTIFRKRSYPKR